MKSELKKYDNINADNVQFINEIKEIAYNTKQKFYLLFRGLDIQQALLAK